LSKKTKLPAIAYLGGHVGWTKLFKRFFVANDYDYRRFIKKVPAEKLINSGSLMVDSVAQSISNSNEKKLRLCQKLMLDPKKPIIAFFPGSRDFSLDYLVPFYAKVIDSLKSQNSNLQMVMSHSPFVNKAKIEKYLSKANLKITLTEDADSIADLTVTIPGTNTGQLAAQGMPMVVVFPLDKPDNIPLEGVADWIGRIPFLGVSFKHLVAAYVNATTKYFALPNQLSNSLIVTELRGKIDPKDVAFQVLALLSDSLRRSEMSLKLKKSMGTAGAAGKIVGEVIKELALGDKA
jgi:lipid A disaccharide synthetase